MDKVERIKMVKAMEFIARNLNDEEIFMDEWLLDGVADGDIEYGDLSVNSEDFDNLDYYIADAEFSTLMRLFLDVMKHASKSGGLYCDEVVSYDE